ncbi:MAG: hypothetical protein V3573_14495 [Desulfovibrionaceae bacterium]
MNISDLVNYVAPEVPGCNVLAIEQSIMEAARSFCAATWVWEHDTSAWIRAGKDTGAIRVPTDMSVLGIVSWESEQTSEPPILYPGGYVRVRRDVTSDTKYTLTVAIQPDRSETEIPDWLDDQYREAIVAHAKHSLLMLPGKDWTNPGRAQPLYQIYRDAVNSTKRDRNTNRMRGVMRVRIPGVN